jgi:homoserine kinase
MPSVIVRIPASTSNLGPGFDCLGVALRIYNFVTVTRGSARTRSEMADRTAAQFFKAAKCKPFDFGCSISGDVPRSRGLGSSATCCLGILHGLNALAGTPLTRAQLFEIAAKLEGHPDNAAPASFGGFNVVRHLQHQKFAVDPRLRFVLLVPDFEIKTPAARKLLPRLVERTGAVESCGAACSITAAFASRKYEQMRGAFGDHLHQPFRVKLLPILPNVIAAGEKAGALGGFLSGSGSTICCVTLRSPKKVAAAMAAASKIASARTLITTADNTGARIFPFRDPRSTIRNSDASLA